jgi:membrane protein
VAGLVGLRLFSAVIFSPLIVSSAVTYGAIGTMLMVVSWLIGIGYVLFGAALVGRVAHESIDGLDGSGGSRPPGSPRGSHNGSPVDRPR